MNLSSPGLSPVDLQHHIYNSLLESKTADIALHVRGTWEAVYRLHRVVLIQSGFFSSLFTAGFLESSHKFSTHRRGPDEIDIQFDDRNITRAAFEICIARLYGGGPPLFISPSLIPSTSHPLTPAFPGPPSPDNILPNHHHATPRFLLSLLATSVYLSIPSLASQALSCILNTVGPYTAVQYLTFAIGKAISPPDEKEPQAAVGLEAIAELTKEGSVAESAAPSEVGTISQKQGRDLNERLRDMDIKEDPTENGSDVDDTAVGSIYEQCFHYGAVSDKVGEAAVCWLARWAPDMLPHEEKLSQGNELPVSSQPSQSRRRADTMPSKPGSSAGYSSSPSPHTVPLIWARGGLSAKWVRVLISADAFFVKGERERYDLARRVVELRRRAGIDAEEEKEWETLFSEGIYYANMGVDDIIALSRDISPTTGKPYVPTPILQAAHWNQSLLRHQIISKPNNSSSPTSPPSSPPPSRDKELGLPITTADILSRLSASGTDSQGDEEKDKVYYPVPIDSSLRIGDNGGIEGASMDQLFEPSAITPSSPEKKSTNRLVTSEANFFGLKADRYIAPACILADATGKSRWSPYPPFRFAVEFWDVDALKEKSRLHSQTIWYAGSLFNVYVQVVRKKGVQLGVYLHRQSSIDPIPAPSAPLQSPSRADRTHNRVPSLPPQIPASASSPSVHYSPSIHPPSRSTTPNSSPSTASTLASPYSSANGIPATGQPVTPPQPYRDSRSSVSAYFTISCASSTGSSLTRFTSSPDVFSVSQSWGWKSSSLRTEEYLEIGPDGQPTNKVAGPAPREVSLRATIVLGII
ncbi:hypothetical protein SERLA73DRAFT_127272 [Serpula lacrymans var. lacrymans S7.3]|uniref:BTB domain-containing protein n=2 Tax=Serpula lacrymans var. lacrymans TaxID=341189 RepID=F8QG64_SERL3|nr:uncharacterized protein SERLADRAFT_374186 [Serpula lacrymans var. lacrymans S7.9]EGN92679.1 hypothetical protein SERLA73DRAFT_127272 [Serpula lacrymans var. lacrymans S7.3]EGO19456.1 hypothetical protein SERLADRAFT_374186 [Serpula lacrymans var. lacrymans S7.9]